MITGSPEWFHQKSMELNKVQFKKEIESARARFLSEFAPEKLISMDGDTLLAKVFGDGDTMRQLLDFSDDYMQFGSTGGYKYLGVVYQEAGEVWKYKEGAHSSVISYSEAIRKAVEVRDALIRCVDVIASMDLNSLEDYEHLDATLSNTFFYTYPWVMKYFQMVFPQYFPGMYADGTLNRAIEIIGLANHGKKRYLNAGEISLFIRRCDVNNIVFNKIYSEEWGWGDKHRPCANASNNFDGRYSIPKDINTSYYELPYIKENQQRADLKIVKEIEDELSQLTVSGIEKEAVVKVRVNQGVFRERLIQKYGKCCLCGVTDSRLLIASHIKPWSKSEDKEKLDVNNGFLMCPNHDKLFDQGWISFNDNGEIIMSDELSPVDRVFMNINDSMSVELNDDNRKYLEYHRNNVFMSDSNLK